MAKILDINHLSIHFKTSDAATIKAVDNVSFFINEGEILGIAGESGSGKSQTALSIMGLLPHHAQISGSIRFMEKEIIGLPIDVLNTIRGNQISMVFQDPMTSLNPYLTIASQMTEVLMLHKQVSYKEALQTALNFLDLTRISDAKNNIHLYPHEFSGGMRQRVMIAMSLLCQPKLLIADEPTTALDVTMQAEILHILKDLQRELAMSILMITHDMGVMANICDRVQIMYAGQMMESGSTEAIFYSPQHPYTQALLQAIPPIFSKERAHHLATIPGEPPNLAKLPRGCVFQDRCTKVHEKCQQDIPIRYLKNNQIVKCALPTLLSNEQDIYE